MKITVNNKEVDTQATQLLQLATELGLPVQGVAIAVNKRMVPRTEWRSFLLEEGAEIIVIKAACGG